MNFNELILCEVLLKKASEYGHGDTTFTHPKSINGTVKKNNRKLNVTQHLEDKESKATSSLFPIKMIEKTRWIHITILKTKDQTKKTKK